MPFIIVKVTDAHIATVASSGYGPRIIIAAIKERLVERAWVAVDTCWVIVVHEGARCYIHLPLHMLPFTYRNNRTPLLAPIAFRIPMPAEMIRPRRMKPRKRAP